MPLPAVLRISTRGSRLALWQAEHVASILGHPTEIRVVKSQGDRIRDVALQGREDQGFFTREIQAAVLAGEADLAVHSLKDLPTAATEGLALSAVPPRETVEDVLLVHPAWHDPARVLPVREGGTVGATSLRRQALLGHFSPDLVPTLLRGNVPTRLDRLRRGEFAAILLARAGLRRLGLRVEGFIAYTLDPHRWIPAPGQAALGIETAPQGAVMEHVRGRLDHAASHRAVDLERALMARFEAGCHAPFGAWVSLGSDDARAGHDGSDAGYDGSGAGHDGSDAGYDGSDAGQDGSGADAGQDVSDASHDGDVTVHIGCGTEQGGWAEARVVGRDAASAAEAAWEALVAAKARGATPGGAKDTPSPCTALEAF